MMPLYELEPIFIYNLDGQAGMHTEHVGSNTKTWRWGQSVIKSRQAVVIELDCCKYRASGYVRDHLRPLQFSPTSS